jgi:hypothetical protein
MFIPLSQGTNIPVADEKQDTAPPPSDQELEQQKAQAKPQPTEVFYPLSLSLSPSVISTLAVYVISCVSAKSPRAEFRA